MKQRVTQGRRRLAFTAALALLALFAAACGGGEEAQPAGEDPTEASETESEAGGLTEKVTLKVGVLPISVVQPYYAAIDAGYFEDENLEVETVPLQGGPALFAALESGDVQVVYAGSTSFFVAVAEGYDFVIVQQNDRENATPDGEFTKEGMNGILVKEDSGIETAKDLEGKSIAVNALRSIIELYARAWMDAHGADHDAAQYVAVPYPDMLNALRDGRVDALNLSEPFISIGLAEGGFKEIGTPFGDVGGPDMQVGGWYAKGDYAQENAEAMKAIARAIRKGAALTNEQTPRERAEVLAKFVETNVDLAASARWWAYNDGPIDIEGFQREADRAFEFGFMSKEIDVGAVSFDSATMPNE